MIFQHTWKLILEGKKWETRRPVKPGERTLFSDDTNTLMVLGANGRIKWEQGKTYAIQPGRGQKAVARRKLLAIRQERLQDISFDDLVAEGMEVDASEFDDPCDVYDEFQNAQQEYEKLWDKINARKGTRWDENPMVWVLTFEVAIRRTPWSLCPHAYQRISIPRWFTSAA